MPKREPSENTATAADSRKTEQSQGGELQSHNIRLADEDWQALEDMAKAERKQTGSNVTASGLARRILRREIGRRTGKSGQTIVV